VSPLRSAKHRSRCAVNLSLEKFGDRWSLLIIRDMIVRGYQSFTQFQQSGEGIATNILAHRLRKLVLAGIVRPETDPGDGRRVTYRLTEKGIDLAPVIFELLVWGTRYEESGKSCSLVVNMAENRGTILREVRRRWEQKDPTPLQDKSGLWHWPVQKQVRARRTWS
jgi:DNA-binding HxlR family transcriptional regulator